MRPFFNTLGLVAMASASGRVSPKDADANFRKLEAQYGEAWYNAITLDTWGAGA